MSLSYAWEKLFVAVESLASGTGTIQRRLGGAYLNLIMLKIDDFPKDLQEDFKEISDVKGDGEVIAAINALSDDEAVKISKKIVSLFDSVAKRDGCNSHIDDRCFIYIGLRQ